MLKVLPNALATAATKMLTNGTAASGPVTYTSDDSLKLIGHVVLVQQEAPLHAFGLWIRPNNAFPNTVLFVVT